MKFSTAALSAILATCTIALPVVYTGSGYDTPDGVSIAELVARGETQLLPRRSDDSDDVELTANEFLDGACKAVVLVYARGSTQDGNLVRFSNTRCTEVAANTGT